MPTSKPPYCGDGSSKIVPDFPDPEKLEALRKKLRGYFPGEEEEPDDVFQSPADTFVGALLEEAKRALDELYSASYRVRKQKVRRELCSIITRLEKAAQGLRNLSPDADCFLGVEADPRAWADTIEEASRFFKLAASRVGEGAPVLRPKQVQHKIAVELAIRILRILREHGIKASASYNPDVEHTSDAVNILASIGAELVVQPPYGLDEQPPNKPTPLKLARHKSMWRDIILLAKEQAPDLDQ